MDDFKISYKDFFENSNTMMYIIDPDTGDIIDANLSARNFYGYSHEEIRSMNINEINILTDEQVKLEMQRAKTSKMNYFVFKHKKKDNSVVNVKVYSTPVKINSKIFLHTIIEAITTESEMQSNNIYMKSILDNIVNLVPFMIFISDENYNILFSNIQFKKFSDSVINLELIKNKKVFDEIINTIPEITQKTLKSKKGNINFQNSRFFSYTCTYINYFGKNSCLIVLWETTELIKYEKIIENQNKELSNKYELLEAASEELLASNEELIALNDELDYLTKETTELNEFMKKLIDLSDKIPDMNKKSLEEFISFLFDYLFNIMGEGDYGSCWIFRNGYVDYVKSVGHNNDFLKMDKIPEDFFNYTFVESSKMIKHIKNPGEKLRDISEKYSYFAKGTKPIKEIIAFDLYFNKKKICGFSIDIAEESDNVFTSKSYVKMELFRTIAESYLQEFLYRSEIIKAKQDAEYANEIKSKFLANMSHELRTPLTGIIGSLEILADSDLKKEQKDFIKMAKSSALGLGDVLNEILEFSKMKAGKITLKNEIFNFESLTEEIHNTFISIAKKKNIDFYYEFLTHEKFFYGDRYRIKQILNNLVGNALKFTDTGYVKIIISDENNFFTVEVKDSGIGIDRKIKENIFSEFVQGDNSYIKKYQGTGLGLSIVKGLIDLMNGKITFESDLGIGTSFRIYLPLLKTDQNKNPEPYEYYPFSKGLLSFPACLIVEDNGINRLAFKKIIEPYFKDIYTAESAFEGLKILDEINYSADIIFTDIQMPGMSGYDFAKEIRNKGQNIFIAGVTGYDSEDDRQKSSDSGINYIIKKPYTKESITKSLSEISELLGGA